MAHGQRILDGPGIERILEAAFDAAGLDGQRVLVIVPDATRSGPLPLMFRALHGQLARRTAALDFLIALGTHQPLEPEAIERHFGLGPGELEGRFSPVRIFNHRWMDPGALRTIGQIPAGEFERLSAGRLRLAVPVSINALVFDYDLLIACGPVFPHEVAGFSGGNKYFFPGIGGRELIDATHWLGALITCPATIGVKHTPVRAAIDFAAGLIEQPRLACCMVVEDGALAGLFAGPCEQAWSQAADPSAQLHIRRIANPVQRVLSLMPNRYDDIWVAAKGMYKLEPVVADGGEVILYAPHISEISRTHGQVIERIGYHVRDYFTAQWDRFRSEPWGVLAHSTHLRGLGTFEDGRERSRIRVSLASGIDAARCRRVCLGYRDPAGIDPQAWAASPDPELLVVPEAGEILYRLAGQGA